MPWTSNGAESHTHKATTRALKELWAKVVNEYLERTGDEGRAIREATPWSRGRQKPASRFLANGHFRYPIEPYGRGARSRQAAFDPPSR